MWHNLRQATTTPQTQLDNQKDDKIQYFCLQKLLGGSFRYFMFSGASGRSYYTFLPFPSHLGRKGEEEMLISIQDLWLGLI